MTLLVYFYEKVDNFFISENSFTFAEPKLEHMNNRNLIIAYLKTKVIIYIAITYLPILYLLTWFNLLLMKVPLSPDIKFKEIVSLVPLNPFYMVIDWVSTFIYLYHANIDSFIKTILVVVFICIQYVYFTIISGLFIGLVRVIKKHKDFFLL